MSALINLTGKRFGKLAVLRRAEDRIRRNGAKIPYWICRCDCGASHEVMGMSLRNGDNISCGCAVQRNGGRPKTHGLSNTPTYISYKNMLGRCYDERMNGYERYGGRGIKVCAQWRGPDGLSNFVADMGLRPKGKTLDRRNVNGDYEPSNCRWATRTEQDANTRHPKR